ncbi:MAG: hypothetical protein WB816_01725 [Methylocystis sp.]
MDTKANEVVEKELTLTPKVYIFAAAGALVLGGIGGGVLNSGTVGAFSAGIIGALVGGALGLFF